MNGKLDAPPEPVKRVTFAIFDGGSEWEAVVNFYDDPVNLVSESIALAVEVVERAKGEDARN